MLLLSSACQMTSKIRPITVDLAINLLLCIAVPAQPSKHGLDDKNLALLEQAKEESIMVSRTFFKVLFFLRDYLSLCNITKTSYLVGRYVLGAF